MIDFNKEFGKILKKERIKQGFSQEQIAEIAGISEVYYRNIEHGKHRLTWIKWLTICTALRIDLEPIVKMVAKDIPGFEFSE